MPDASAAGRMRSIVDLVGELFKTPLPSFIAACCRSLSMMLTTYVPAITRVPLSLFK
jgi:hypothetical protein